jgi:hypothetical protein
MMDLLVLMALVFLELIYHSWKKKFMLCNGLKGEIEIRELEFNKIIQNKVIDSIDEFQNVINKWHEEKQKFDNAFVDSNNLIAE